MKNIYLALIMIMGGTSLYSSPGDTTRVTAHQKVDMTWYGNYDAWAAFPDGSASYNRIYLYYTMGCATGGCSDWDYTTQIQLLHKTGGLDSTILSIDTTSVNPLVIDTTWSVFDAYEPFELARVITPYGNSLPNSWTHTFVFDVTDYYPLLKDSMQVRAFYSGYSSGFSATTEFVFVEGQPSRKVLDIQNVYQGYFNYLNSAQVESTHLPARDYTINAQSDMVSLRVLPSGHGFVNSLNCAEFCEKDYYVKVNNQQVASQSMWRDDCGLNPIWPQAGTWLFDRANWCPGDKALWYNHDITSSVQAGAVANLDIDIEPYSYTVPAGEVPAGYFFTAQLIQYEDIIYQTEAELADILAPSGEDRYGRYNPICGKLIVKVRNNGKDPLAYADIEYGIEGGTRNTYHWVASQSLEFGEEEIVSIPIPDSHDWVTYTGSLGYEAAVLNPNGKADELPYNNRKKVSFEAPPVFPADIRMMLRTNNFGSETFWSLSSADGSLIASGDNLQGNTSYTDTFHLPVGCYNLHIGDRGKDGLSFFANNAGNGSVRLQNAGGAFFSKVINSNFGTEVNLYFTVGLGIGLQEAGLANVLEIFPNPTQDRLNIRFAEAGSTNITLMDVQGKILQERSFTTREYLDTQLDLSRLPSGIYLLKVTNENGSHIRKIKVY